MYCPKCGKDNPDEGRFCRSCGTNLSLVPDALTGKLAQPTESRRISRYRRPLSWESALTRFFSGLAFLIIAIILAITGAAGGRYWWYWMLIPAFGGLGRGIAQMIQLRAAGQQNYVPISTDTNPELSSKRIESLPESKTEFVSPPKTIYETGEVRSQPPSVTEGTTRHLELNDEGETISFPKSS